MYWNPNMLSEEQLMAKLKTLGYEFDQNYLYRLPARYDSRKGILKDGNIEFKAYYDYTLIVKFLEDLKACNMPEQLKAHGIELKSGWEVHAPYTLIDGHYVVKLDEMIEFMNCTNSFNLNDKLLERGHVYTKNKKTSVHINLYCTKHETYLEKRCEIFDIDKLIGYLETVNDINLEEKLLEKGFNYPPDFIEFIKYDYTFSKATNLGFNTYDLDLIEQYSKDITEYNLFKILEDKGYTINYSDRNHIKYYDQTFFNTEKTYRSYYIDKIIDYLDKRDPSKKDKIFKPLPPKEIDNFSKEETNATLSSLFYNERSFIAKFPIHKWYSKKFNAIPDMLTFDYVHIKDFLETEKYKLCWCTKSLHKQLNTYFLSSIKILRSFDAEKILESIDEAILEIDEGMYLHIYRGSVEWDDEQLTASVRLYYQEGKHDPTKIIQHFHDKEIYYSTYGQMSLLYRTQYGFDVEEFTIPYPYIDFNKHYNKGFEEVSQRIFMSLLNSNTKGLILLYGKPGTGKTTYLRYLMQMTHKEKIYIPNSYAEYLSDPAFIPFLLKHPNSIIVLEDADNILLSRELGGSSQAVSNILNLTDGLLNDCLDIQIVATFNSSIKKIDKALLRKGRLLEKYEFKALTPDRAEDLALSLGVWFDDMKNLTLADIYEKKNN